MKGREGEARVAALWQSWAMQWRQRLGANEQIETPTARTEVLAHQVEGGMEVGAGETAVALLAAWEAAAMEGCRWRRANQAQCQHAHIVWQAQAAASALLIGKCWAALSLDTVNSPGWRWPRRGWGGRRQPWRPRRRWRWRPAGGGTYSSQGKQ